MLTGSFRSYPIHSIIVTPERQRKELTGIEELADSIRQLGLIHPIVIDPDGVLVAGERRLRAHEHLGLTHILVQFTTDLPREELEAIELEENVKRKALTWREEVSAIVRLHRLKQRQNPEWNNTNTAELISVDRSVISRAMMVTEFMEQGDPLVLAADTYSSALNICERKIERAKSEDKVELDAAIDAVFASPINIGKTRAPAAKPSGQLEAPLVDTQPPVPYLHADFRQWAKEPYTGPKFNFLHCDFPYGINFDKHNGGATGLLGGYEDTPELYGQCLTALASIMEDRVDSSAHLMFWLSARHEIVHATREALTDMGWKLNPVPLIWHRSDNSGILPDHNRGPRQVYEVCLFGSRGDRKIVQAVSNLLPHAKTKEVHASEKPRPMLQHFFRMFVDESTVMLDPTMGSGNAVLAAEEAGARHVLGLEALEEIYANAVSYRNRVKARS
jgi:ParB/RepB/Spo0J family partition protein